MNWMYYIKKGPEREQGWTGQTLASIRTPPPALLTIFGVVIISLWLSQYAGYKAQLHLTAVNFKLFLILLPILLILITASDSSSGGYSFRLRRLQAAGSSMQPGGGGGMRWGIGILVVVLLVLLYCQSSFHSKWFGGS